MNECIDKVDQRRPDMGELTGVSKGSQTDFHIRILVTEDQDTSPIQDRWKSEACLACEPFGEHTHAHILP